MGVDASSFQHGDRRLRGRNLGEERPIQLQNFVHNLSRFLELFWVLARILGQLLLYTPAPRP